MVNEVGTGRMMFASDIPGVNKPVGFLNTARPRIVPEDWLI